MKEEMEKGRRSESKFEMKIGRKREKILPKFTTSVNKSMVEFCI